MSAGQFRREVRPERSQLQPAGRDELPDDQPGVQGGGGAPAEDSAQHTQQGRQVSADSVVSMLTLTCIPSYILENAQNLHTSSTRVTKELAKSLIRRDSDLSNYHQK